MGTMVSVWQMQCLLSPSRGSSAVPTSRIASAVDVFLLLCSSSSCLQSSAMAAEGRRRAQGLSKPCILIIVVASVERFAYKGVASNLVTYLTDHVKLGTSAAAKSVNNWCGITSMLPLVGALLADSYWDRYFTILGSSLVYVAGLVALTSWVLLCTWMPAASLFLPLYLISVGQGGYNPSLQAFGADQLEIGDDLSGKHGGEEKSRKRSMFFQWWYFGICTGSLLGNSIMSYIQDTYGWGLGFAIPTAVMAASVACFTAGASCYVRNQHAAEDSRRSRPIEDMIRGIKRAVLNRVHRGGAFKLPPREADVAELELQAQPLSEESGSLEKEANQQQDPPAPSVGRTILKLLPIWTLLLMFAVIFQLPSTFFTRQGATMKRNIGSFMVPPATLQSSITISIILLMPLYDKLIIPVISAVTRRDKGITVLQRIGVGMVFSILAMVVAATVEARRLRSQERKDPQPSILWLLPQYVLLGVSDVFTVVGMQEFFYAKVPSTMRTIGIGLYLSVFGVGSFLGSALISVVEMVSSAAEGGGGRGWLPDDMEEARLDKYYWLLALLSSVSFVWFMCLCKRYEEDGEASTY